MPRPVLARLRPQPQHCSGYNFTTLSTRSPGTNGRFRPSCPSCPPGLRLLFFLLPRCRGEPDNPSEEGGLDEALSVATAVPVTRNIITAGFNIVGRTSSAIFWELWNWPRPP